MESHNENQLLPSPANAPSGSSHPRDHSQQAGDAIHEHDPRSSPRSAPGHMLQSERTPTPLTSLAGFHQHTDEETRVAPSPYTAEIREIVQTELREARAAHVADMASLRRNMEEQFNQFMERRFSQMVSSSSRGKQVQETPELPPPEYYATPNTRPPSEATLSGREEEHVHGERSEPVGVNQPLTSQVLPESTMQQWNVPAELWHLLAKHLPSAGPSATTNPPSGPPAVVPTPPAPPMPSPGIYAPHIQ